MALRPEAHSGGRKSCKFHQEPLFTRITRTTMAAKSIIDRAKSILLTPRTEWPVIAEEPDTVGGLYTKYIVIMAAIPALVHFISASLIGVSVPILGYYRVGVAAALSAAIVSYVVGLVGIFITMLIVDALAPTFRGQTNKVQALKAVAYA